MQRWIGLGLALGSGCTASTDDTGTEYASTTQTYDLSTEVMSDGGTLWVSYTTSPDPIVPAETFSVTFSLSEADQLTPVTEIESLVADATMPAHKHGMNVIPETTEAGEGAWSGSPFQFHMTGHWEITATVVRDGVEDVARFNVDCCEY